MADLPFTVQKFKIMIKSYIKINWLKILRIYSVLINMANHVSAKKRSRQNKNKNAVNSQYLSKFRTALNKFQSSLNSKNDDEIKKSFSAVNSIMAKALKKGIFKKENISRKLSSLSKQIQKN